MRYAVVVSFLKAAGISVILFFGAWIIATSLAAGVRDLPDDAPFIDSLVVFQDTVAVAEPETPSPTAAEIWADSVLYTLSLEQRIAQLLIVHMDPNGLIGMSDPMQAVQRYQVSGFIVPRLMAPEEVRRNTRRLQAASPLPLFMAADYERGVGRFNNNFTELPSNMAIGASRDVMLAEAAGLLTALESRAIGVNLVFAPVVDVNNNPNNPIINTRSYGEDPVLVGDMAAAFIRGAEGGGVLTTAKHFPGHGNTDIDTHLQMAQVPGTREEVEQTELAPYRRLFGSEDSPAMVMTAHLWVPALDDEPVPATLSARTITHLLRNELGYDGLVITDDIMMGGVTQRFAFNESVIRALQAGVDILLTPRNIGHTIDIVKEALQDGRLSQEQLNNSVRRVLRAKAEFNLHLDRFPDDQAFARFSARALGEHVADSVASKSVTVVKAAGIPPVPVGSRVAVVQLGLDNQAASVTAAMNLLAERLGAHANVTPHRFLRTPTRAEVTSVMRAVESADVVVVAKYMRVTAFRTGPRINQGQDELIRRILRTQTPVIFVSMGNPYIVTRYDEAAGIIIAYDQTLATARSVAGVLTGREPARGRLPITVGRFAFGSGLAEAAYMTE